MKAILIQEHERLGIEQDTRYDNLSLVGGINLWNMIHGDTMRRMLLVQNG